MHKIFIFTLVLFITFVTSGCFLQSERGKEASEKLDSYNKVFNDTVYEEGKKITASNPGINDVSCFNKNVCSYLIIFDWNGKAENLEEKMVDYTKEFANLKQTIFNFKDKGSVNLKALADVEGGESILCSVDGGFTNGDYKVKCEEVDPKEYR